MKVQLPTGKTVDISLEDYLNLDDKGYQKLVAMDAGSYIDNPFITLTHEDNEIEDLNLEEIPYSIITKIDPEIRL